MEAMTSLFTLSRTVSGKTTRTGFPILFAAFLIWYDIGSSAAPNTESPRYFVRTTGLPPLDRTSPFAIGDSPSFIISLTTLIAVPRSSNSLIGGSPRSMRPWLIDIFLSRSESL